MQLAKWAGVCTFMDATRSGIHLGPAACRINAPYPATARVTIFSPFMKPIYVTLDGFRLGEADGLWLDDAFPKLKEYTSFWFGLKVELSANQPHLDLSNSTCCLEFFSKGISTKIVLPFLNHHSSQAQFPNYKYLKLQKSHSYSLIVLNMSRDPFACSQLKLGMKQSTEALHIMMPLSSDIIESESLYEYSINDECISILIDRSATIEQEFSCFLVGRAKKGISPLTLEVI